MPTAISVMMTKMTGCEKRAVQCSAITSGLFCVVSVVIVVFILFGLDHDLRFVVDSQATRGDHLLAFVHASQNLHAIAFADPDCHFALVRYRALVDDHHLLAAFV